MAKQQVSITLLLLILFYGCQNRSKSSENMQDEFYSVSGGWDWVRVPLLKPYVVKRANPKINMVWDIEFIHSFGTYNVKRVDVQDSVIYILSGNIGNNNDSTIVNTENVPTAWFVIDVRSNIEKGFDNEEEFRAYLRTHNYPNPKWHDIDSLSESFGALGTVPWAPK